MTNDITTTAQALDYILHKQRHENETLQEFAHRIFHQKRIIKKMRKQR